MKSWRAGRAFGVDILIHPTFALVFVVAILYWALGDHGGIEPFLSGVVLAVLIYLSTIVHEFGHCFMAQQFGTPVREITLFPIFGVSQVETVPTSPQKEGLIAFAGPAMSFAVAMFLLPIVIIMWLTIGTDRIFNEQLFLRPTLTTIIPTVAIFNLGLMIASLLPAFPLDGGRMLRAAMTPRFGRARATTIAAQTAIGVAILLLIVGIVLRNLLLPVFTIVIIFAARAELRAARIEAQMKSLTVGQYAMWDMGGIGPNQPLTFALRGGPRDMAVTVRGRVVGMLWRQTLLDGLLGGVAGRRVSDIMDRDVFTADVGDSIYDVEQLMHKHQRWAVPVTENGLYRGMFTADRFVSVHRQLAPRFGERDLPISAEWREALAATVKRVRRR